MYKSDNPKQLIRIYAEDVDFMGIVYHANYLFFLERSRTELLRQYHLSLSELQQRGIQFAISELSIKYRFPAKLDDLLLITTKVRHVKRCSIQFEQSIVNQHQQLICDAQVIVVCINEQQKPQRLPDSFKELST